VKLGNIIVKENNQQSAARMVYGTNPKLISNIITFDAVAIVARHSDKKIRSKPADIGNTVMSVVYSNIHEKDVYEIMNIAAQKTMTNVLKRQYLAE
jgi:hypothetical protein